MGVTAIVVSTVITAAAAYMSYEGQRKQASAEEDRAMREAQIAREREEREARLEKERIEYESNLAKTQAEWEIKTDKERADYTMSRIKEEADLVRATQIVGYAASGLGGESKSQLALISRTSRIAREEREQVFRSHEVFAEARTMEAEEVKKGGEFGYSQFMTRLHAETGYAVESRIAEASMARTKKKYAEYGKYLSIAGSALKGYGRYKTYKTTGVLQT